jgi:cytidylate kinase
MVRIVAIEREFGCGAGGIAQKLADKLGWKLWDREVTCEIARRLKCKTEQVEEREERLDSMFYRMMKVFMRGSFEPQVDTAGLELLDAEHLSIFFQRLVTELAEKGNAVIVGRGSPWFVRDRGDALRLFLYAPYEEKLRRTVERTGNKREAENLLDTVDRDRAAFIRRYYNKEWPDRYVYNLMINTNCGDEHVLATITDQLAIMNARMVGSAAQE